MDRLQQQLEVLARQLRLVVLVLILDLHPPPLLAAPLELEAVDAASGTTTLLIIMEIRRDDLSGHEIQALLAEHMRGMRSLSPPESVHALDLAGLRAPGITFWSAWSGRELLGCGALKELDPYHGEIKSMRTSPAHLRKGVARAMLEHILAEAIHRGYNRLSLETGSQSAFHPAHRLYERFGFTRCPPFAGYREDPNSVFMTKLL